MKVMFWIVLITGITACTTWWLCRTRTMLNRWAERNGLKLLEYSVMPFPPYPPIRVTLTSSRSQLIVRTRVHDDRSHRIRQGWQRPGSFWWGLLNIDAVEVFRAGHQGLSNEHGF